MWSWPPASPVGRRDGTFPLPLSIGAGQPRSIAGMHQPSLQPRTSIPLKLIGVPVTALGPSQGSISCHCDDRDRGWQWVVGESMFEAVMTADAKAVDAISGSRGNVWSWLHASPVMQRSGLIFYQFILIRSCAEISTLITLCITGKPECLTWVSLNPDQCNWSQWVLHEKEKRQTDWLIDNIRERERQTDRQRERETDRETEIETQTESLHFIFFIATLISFVGPRRSFADHTIPKLPGENQSIFKQSLPATTKLWPR